MALKSRNGLRTQTLCHAVEFLKSDTFFGDFQLRFWSDDLALNCRNRLRTVRAVWAFLRGNMYIVDKRLTYGCAGCAGVRAMQS